MFFRPKSYNKDRLILFGRYPQPGRVKTRLIPALGPTGAAELQRQLTEQTFEKVMKVTSNRNIDVEFRFDGGRRSDLRRWLGAEVLFSEQGPGDLGVRMHNAFIHAFQQGCRRVVLLGTDIPGLKTDHLNEAFEALRDKNLVLGPSADGGYWLMGLRKSFNLFQGVEWGTGKVLEQSLSLAEGKDLDAYQLETLRDLDMEEDLRQWKPEVAFRSPYLSVIIPTLNEAKHIEKTIRKARDDEVEIIVVDGGSIDDTIAKATEAGAQVITCSPGRAEQQNRGAAMAHGKILLFLHADTWLPKGYVSYIFEALLDPRTVVGAFRFKTDTDLWTMRVVDLMTNLRAWTLKIPYGDQALFFRKALFDSVGGFPKVPISEDLLLVKRLAKKGKVRLVPAPVITSGRRWQTLGVLRTSLINVVIATAISLGFSPNRFTHLYKNNKTHHHL